MSLSLRHDPSGCNSTADFCIGKGRRLQWNYSFILLAVCAIRRGFWVRPTGVWCHWQNGFWMKQRGDVWLECKDSNCDGVLAYGKLSVLYCEVVTKNIFHPLSSTTRSLCYTHHLLTGSNVHVPDLLSWPRSGVCRTLFTYYHFFSPCITIQNLPEHSTYFCYDAYSRSFQYDVEWRSTFHELPGLSIWLICCGSIYYRLYGIKYKYCVVAILYSQSCIHLHLDNPFFLSSLVQFELCALLWPSDPCTTDLITAPQSCSHWAAKSCQALDICCQGCNRVFSPCGLSQHLSRTPNAVCHEVQMTSRTPSLFQTVTFGLHHLRRYIGLPRLLLFHSPSL